jgi:hypothetical protein
MSESRRVHCRFCGQTFITDEVERCPLCRKSGGFVSPDSPAAVEDLFAEKCAEPAPLPSVTSVANMARGSTDYLAVPWYRTSGFCSGVALAHALVMGLGLCVPGVWLLGVFTGVGVIAVCLVVLTGPVYYRERRKDGTLKTWSRGNRAAAVVLLVLFIGGYVALAYLVYRRGL